MYPHGKCHGQFLTSVESSLHWMSGVQIHLDFQIWPIPSSPVCSGKGEEGRIIFAAFSFVCSYNKWRVSCWFLCGFSLNHTYCGILWLVGWNLLNDQFTAERRKKMFEDWCSAFHNNKKNPHQKPHNKTNKKNPTPQTTLKQTKKGKRGEKIKKKRKKYLRPHETGPSTGLHHS